jgi:hypothetical protein
MFKTVSFLIKEEIFRQLLAEEFSLLSEATPTTLPEIHKWFHSLDKGKKRRLVREVNTILLYNLSKDKLYLKFVMKNYVQDENLALNLLLYVSGEYSLMESFFKPYVAKMYGTYITRFYLNPKGFFGRKAIITGNQELDNIILNAIQTEFESELGSNTNKNLPSQYENILSDLEIQIQDVIDTNEKQLTDRLNESFLDPHKVEKLLSSIQHIFYLNQATIKTMRTILKSMNVEDMKRIASGGQSNTSNILALGVMRRAAELLYRVKLTDPIMAKMLGLLAYRLISQNSKYHGKLKPSIARFITKKMAQVKKPTNTFSKMQANRADYAGG